MNRAVGLCVIVSFAAACAPSVRERYRTAVVHKSEGDMGAYYEALLKLAANEPHTREGRRARAILQGSSPLVWIAAVAFASGFSGTMMGSGVPAQTGNTEARDNLTTIAAAMNAFKQEHGRYCVSFEECGLVAEPTDAYVYYMSPREVGGGQGAKDGDLLRLKASLYLEARGPTPYVKEDAFLVVAVGMTDQDELDIWSVDHTGTVRHERDPSAMGTFQ